MNASGVGGADGQEAPNMPQSPSLAQLKEALRVLEQTQLLFNGMKAKVMYACGEGHLLASDEGRPYLTKIIKSLDEEHRQVRAGFPRLSAALEVARVVNKLSALRASRNGAVGGAAGSGIGSETVPGSGLAAVQAAAGRSTVAAAEAATAAAPAAALQAHCRSVVEQLEAAVCEEMLAAGSGLLPRLAKRPRTGDAPESQAAEGTSTSTSTSTAASAGMHKSLEAASQLLCVLLRIRALDGSATSMAGGSATSLGGMKIHALDEGGNALSLPSALIGAMMAAAQGQTQTQAQAQAPAGGQGTGGGGVARLEGPLLTAGAARLCSATQVRMLLPGVFVANVLLEGPGNPAPLRVTIDCADKAFELDPWATPTTQVFRRISALATRVLTYYVKRALLSAVPRTLASPTGVVTGTAASTGTPVAAAASTGVAALLPPEPTLPGAAALEDMLLWLLSCRDVFSKRCAATGRLMAWDPSVQYPVPPIFRVFKLPREELRLRALDLSRAAAYHMHVAPIEQLGWAEDVPAEAVDGLGTSGGTAEAPAAVVAKGSMQVPTPMVVGMQR
ncbi:hypothetical protein Vretimale_3376 [Volvox reticuliferus]|uniref:Uncharacterized protein n=1 Tax=Volvox reticuliferus TaxID=1737510 RepID=A0A8J4D8H0_9CHLO|nr:hypothetical protein Vretifemale_944 [Volvox reticuliferus]GIL97828.1 hypothetical protein Vretimale_3376 [Volvox reticuliferus]